MGRGMFSLLCTQHRIHGLDGLTCHFVLEPYLKPHPCRRKVRRAIVISIRICYPWVKLPHWIFLRSLHMVAAAAPGPAQAQGWRVNAQRLIRCARDTQVSRAPFFFWNMFLFMAAHVLETGGLSSVQPSSRAGAVGGAPPERRLALSVFAVSRTQFFGLSEFDFLRDAAPNFWP